MIKNYYKILNVNKGASKQEIKSAYRKLIKFWHPDVNSNPQAHNKIVEINEAYEILYDDNKRATYDRLYQFYFESSQSKRDETSYEYKEQRDYTHTSESGRKVNINIEIDLEKLEEWIAAAKLSANEILKKGIKKVDSGLETGFYAVGQAGNCLGFLFAIGFGIAFLVSPIVYFGKLIGGEEEFSLWRTIISIVFGGIGILIIVGMLKGGLNPDDD